MKAKNSPVHISSTPQAHVAGKIFVDSLHVGIFGN